jgi:hypothetical protein
MGLVLATAVGFALMRIDGERSMRYEEIASLFDPSTELESSRQSFDAISYGVRGIQPLLFTWTLAILLFRLRRPRPPLCRLARQPGFAASSGVTLVSLIFFLGAMISCLHWPSRLSFGWHCVTWYFSYIFDDSLAACGAAVAATWAVMALGRTLRLEASWIDRAGRFLGIAWLVMLALLILMSLPD